MKTILKALRETQEIRAIDLQLAQFAGAMDAQPSELVVAATALASRAVGAGDVCVVLQGCVDWAQIRPELALPDTVQEWRDQLGASQALHSEQGEATALLVLDCADRLYLNRYYQQEQGVAVHLQAAAQSLAPSEKLDETALALDLLFSPEVQQPDWQRVAAAVALRQRFVLISGGPGTGKTRTVARLLCLLQHLCDAPLRMALAAPTGKAAARLSQSIQREVPALQKLLPEAAALVPLEASTLHRLLGYRPGGGYRHDANNPLALDLLLVDEASMLDLAMMSRLLEAIPPQARLVFLGDRDQLASVEAGNVLADIAADLFDQCSAEMLDYLQGLSLGVESVLQVSQHPLADSVTLLRHSYRFGADSPVGNLSAAINTGDWATTQQLLDAGHEQLQYLPAGSDGRHAASTKFLQHYSQLMQSSNPADALRSLTQFQLLCGVRRGAVGVDEVNSQMARVLSRAGLVPVGEQQKGRAIMILQNDYGQRLYNGDVGLFWPDEQGKLQVWFDDGVGGLRAVLPARLPLHESCYAMTIHKTQGSEFNEVCILLPDEPAAILNRQLLYTGVTRARETVSLCGTKEIIESMLSSQTQRQSGLREALSKTPKSNG